MTKIIIILLIFLTKINIGEQPKINSYIVFFDRKINNFSDYLFGKPIKYNTTAPSHPNWGNLRRSWHNNQAWDIFVEENTPVYSIIEGIVFITKFRENKRTVWGHNIIIENNTEKIFYTHLDEILLCPGDTVNLGQLVGYVGKWPAYYRLRDNSHMPSHLHIAIYKHKLNKYLDRNLKIQVPLTKSSIRGILDI